MPDITKCRGEKCPERDRCYRYLAGDNSFRQSYFLVTPPINPDGRCDYFWETIEEEKE